MALSTVVVTQHYSHPKSLHPGTVHPFQFICHMLMMLCEQLPFNVL